MAAQLHETNPFQYGTMSASMESALAAVITAQPTITVTHTTTWKTPQTKTATNKNKRAAKKTATKEHTHSKKLKQDNKKESVTHMVKEKEGEDHRCESIKLEDHHRITEVIRMTKVGDEDSLSESDIEVDIDDSDPEEAILDHSGDEVYKKLVESAGMSLSEPESSEVDKQSESKTKIDIFEGNTTRNNISEEDQLKIESGSSVLHEHNEIITSLEMDTAIKQEPLIDINAITQQILLEEDKKNIQTDHNEAGSDGQSDSGNCTNKGLSLEKSEPSDKDGSCGVLDADSAEEMSGDEHPDGKYKILFLNSCALARIF